MRQTAQVVLLVALTADNVNRKGEAVQGQHQAGLHIARGFDQKCKAGCQQGAD